MKGLVKLNIKDLKTDNKLLGFSALVTVICILNIVFNTINGRFWMPDFKVYYMAAKTLASGGQVYLQSFSGGKGFYKYSPVILFFFLPSTLFSYTTASVIHFFILSFAFWYTFLVIREILTIYFPKGIARQDGLLLSLSFLCILLHLVRELYLGNINILLLLLCLLTLRYFLSGKPLWGSILLGIVLLTKPFFLILLIPLVFRKQGKSLSWLSLVIIMGLVLPFLFPGPGKSILLYADWGQTMLNHDQEFPGMNSIDYLMEYYFSLDLPSYSTFLIILIAGIAISFFIFMNMHKERKSPDQSNSLAKMNFIFEWFLILALIPNIVKTDSEHFLASAPLFVFLIYYVVSQRKYWLVPVLVILLLFYDGNSTDLLGRDLSKKIFSLGLLGISNILIICLALFLYLDFRKNAVHSG